VTLGVLRIIRAKFMRNISTLFSRLIIASCAVVIAGSAFAAESIDVRAGGSFSTKIAVWNSSNCEAGPYPRVEFGQPANGNLTSKKGRSKEPAGSACAGKTLPGMVITYKPKKGFRGKDCGSISLNYPEFVSGGGETSRRYDVCFNVK
jgi:hypothetical protein